MELTFLQLPGRVLPSMGRNQMGVVNNTYQQQDKFKRVLTVCSAGILRSATIAWVLSRDHDFNVRNCGVSQEYALVPISVALLSWADHVVFAEQEHYQHVADYMTDNKKSYQVLNLPDTYSYREPALVQLIQERFKPELVV